MYEVFHRTMWNYDRDAVSLETGLDCSDSPSLAVQAEKEEADINTIVRRFGLTGRLPENVRAPTYGDFTGIGDYRSCIDAARQAEASFMAMPAETRARFDNDPQAFLEFCSVEANLPEMRKLGLAVPSVLDSAGTTDAGASAPSGGSAPA